MDARTLNTLNGTRFPVVFGQHEAERYARSLEGELVRMRQA